MRSTAVDAIGVEARTRRGPRVGRARQRLAGRLAWLVGTACLASFAILPIAFAAEVKRLYIGNDDHTDYMWAATDLEYRAAFQNMLDYYMAQAEATAGNPSDARGRFNCDGSLWVWEYERERPGPDFDRLIGHLRAGTITMPLQTVVPLYGAMPTEAVLRDMYYAGRLERRYGLRFPIALSMENQTMPGGVASLWAGAGAKYSWKGICNCVSNIDAANRPREIYHFVGPDGGSVCMKWNTHFSTTTAVGGYAEARDPAGVVAFMDQDPAFLARWPWPVAAAFGYGGDPVESTTEAFIDASLDLSDSTRRVIVSNVVDFFEDFTANHGDEIESFSGGFGNEWDLYTASLGEVTASFKRHVEKLRGAEALATVASLLDPAFMNGRESVRDSAFLACGVFYDHDWTADGPVSKAEREQFQRDRLADFERYVNPLFDDARTAVAARITQPPGSERHMVFNPLSWTRTDVATFETSTPTPRHVVDVATGLEVPSETVADDSTHVRILASDVPSVGYKVFEVRAGAGQSFPPSATVTLPTIEGEYYRVTLGPNGTITSLVDKKDGNRELVNSASGGGISDLGSGGSGSVVLDHAGPVSTRLSLSATGAPDHDVHVTLYAGIDRVDIEGTITENFGGTVEYDFDFDLPGAIMRHEETGMIARVARAADGGDYADQNTRTDYLTFNHFVDLSQPDRGVTLSNWDSPFFRPGNSSELVLDDAPSIAAVVGMQVDGPTFGFEDQGGDARFLNRFALRTHGGYDPPAAMRFALEHQNPLISARVTGGASDALPEDEWSLVSLTSSDLLLWALKPAEEGIEAGMIARVWNLADSPRAMELSLPGEPVLFAFRTTHIETNLDVTPLVGGAVVDSLQRQGLRTYRLIVGSLASVPRPSARRLSLSASPNPARAAASSTIVFTLPTRTRAHLGIYDVRGARVATLTDGVRAAGTHRLRWDGAGTGGQVAPGIYFARLDAAGASAVAKLVRLR